MTTHYIDVIQYVHRCPGQPDRHHVIDRQQTIVHTQPGGPCQKPFTANGMETPCGRIAVYDKQCPACRTHIVINHIETIDLGYQGAEQAIADGYNDTPDTLFEVQQ